MPDPNEVEAEDAVKIGAEISRRNRDKIQGAHDALAELGAVCASGKSIEIDPKETYVNFGGMVKAVQVEGGWNIKAPLVVFSDANDPDLTGDFFDASTDFDMTFPGQSTVYFNHGMDKHFKKRRLEPATLTKDDFAVWADTILKETDDYEKFLIEQGKAGKLGMSSGVPGHLVEREAVGKAMHITYWPLGKDASFTHTPAEPKTRNIIPLKSLITQPTEAAVTAPVSDKATNQETNEENKMPEITPELKELIAATSAEAAKTALEAYQKSLPATTTAGLSVTLAEGDRPFKSLGEQLKAGKDYEMSKGAVYDLRLKKYEVKTQNELVGSEGGFLVQPDFATEILKPIHEEGPFSSRARKLPIGNNANSGSINGVDETSRKTGSRWGGVRGYRLGEGALKTASTATFRQILWRLKKYAVVVEATDELLEDTLQLTEVIRTGASEELSFMLNEDMFSGDGAGGPLGYSLCPALVTVSKENNQGADTVIAENIIKMYSRMYSRSMSKAVWYINQDVLPQLFTMAVSVGLGGTPLYMPPGGLSGQPYATLLGRPVVVNEFSSTLGDLGDITFADMGEYLWWEKSAVQEAFSGHIYFLYDKGVYRFVYRVDGKPSWNSALTPNKGSNTVSPFVILAERA